MTGQTVTGGRRNGGVLRIILWGIVAALLALPAISMQFTNDVNWTAGDFVFATVLLGGTGLLLELTVRSSPSWAYRGGVAIGLAAAFLLIWINGAVGIIGSENNDLNAIYLVEILLALAGALLACFRAWGMALAMASAGLAQAAITLTILLSGLGAGEPPGPLGIFVINAFFTGMWTISAGLFWKAAQD